MQILIKCEIDPCHYARILYSGGYYGVESLTQATDRKHACAAWFPDLADAFDYFYEKCLELRPLWEKGAMRNEV